MIEIGSKKNKYTYNAYHIVKSFFPGEEIIQKVDEKQEPLVAVRLPGGSCFSLAPEEIHIDAAGFGTEEAHEQAVKREVTRRLYRYLSEETGRTLAWGTLTGVRTADEDPHGTAGAGRFRGSGGVLYDGELLCESGESASGGGSGGPGECAALPSGL